MALAVGSRLGHYDVTALVGEGGMGQVYQATDTHLDRQVAIKVLPDAFASDADRLARFEREAKVLASLNHPNIGAIYGLEKSGDTRALVLELIEGPTLADRIAQGAIPVDEALTISRQIAEALEAAHEQGIIHRDLKPANIKVKDDGTVKVLDFGLAKALDTTSAGNGSLSPVVTASMTALGIIVGTAAYMSPEQARGMPVDKRADIWSFGYVLYETVVGTRPFAGRDAVETLAAAMTTEPDWSALPPNLPVSIEHLLRRCLKREPKERLRDIGDARAELDEASVKTRLTTVGAIRPSRNRRFRAIIAGSALAVAIVASLATWNSGRPAESESVPPAAFTVPTPRGFPVLPSVSPDGQTIAFSGYPDLQIYLRHVDQLEPVLLHSAGRGFTSGFSPDGEWLLVSGGPVGSLPELRKVPVDGKRATFIAGSAGRAASWGPDDTIVRGSREGLLIVPASGGDLTPLTRLADGEVAHFFPHVLPTGRAVLFQIWTGERDTSQVALYDFERGERRTLLRGMSPQFARSGHLVYWSDDTLWAVPFDSERLEVEGDPVPVVEGVAAQFDGFGHYAVGADGTLVYVPVPASTQRRSLVWVDRQGNEAPATADERPYSALELSPDGGRVAVEIQGSTAPAMLARTQGNTDIWVYELDRDGVRRLTFDPGDDRSPVWTPDGERIAFRSTRDGVALNLYWTSATGGGQTERLASGPEMQTPHSFSPDGRSLVFQGMGALRKLQTGSGGAAGATVIVRDATQAAVSPDGRWLAYVSRQPGEGGIYVRPFPNVDDGRWPVSQGPGESPVWGPEGEELFYLSPDGESDGVSMMAATIETTPAFSPGVPAALFKGSYLTGKSFDTRDGRRFLMIKAGQDAGQQDLVVVQNWTEELTRLLPVD